MPTNLVKLSHGDQAINQIQRHNEDAFNAVNRRLTSGSLLSTLSSSLESRFDTRFDARYVFTSASVQRITSSFQVSGNLDLTGTLNTLGNVNMAFPGVLIVSGSAAVRRLGVGMLANANIPLVVSSSNFTSVYVTTSGTRCALELDAATAGQQSVVQFDEAGAQKYLIGKQTNNTFILYDATRNKNPFVYNPVTNALGLQNADGTVGIGTNAPGVNLEVSSGSANGGVAVKIVNTSATSAQALLNLYTGIRNFTITSDQNGNLAFNDDTAGANRAYFRGSDGMLLVNASAYVSTSLGVGTATPSQKLHVLGGDALVSHGVDNGSAFLQVYNSSSVNPSSYLDLNTGVRNYRIYNNLNGTFGIYDNTAGAYRSKIDSSGRMGVGSSDPSVFMHIQGDTLIVGSASITSTSPSLAIKNTTAAASFPSVYLELSSALKTWRLYGNSSSEFGIYDNGAGAYRLKIDSAGRVGVGMTPSSDLLCVAGTMQSWGYRCLQGTSGPSYGNAFNTWWTGGALQAYVDTTNVGTFSLTCDRRLKQQVRPYTEKALDAVSAINIVRFRWKDKDIWKDDGNDHVGFMADEVQAVIPTAVNGDVSGSQYQNLNLVDILAVQMKAIQELKEIVDRQAQQIKALQTKPNS